MDCLEQALQAYGTPTFDGNDFGEYLVAGGTIRYATVPKGSLIPEPASVALMGVGLTGLAVAVGF